MIKKTKDNLLIIDFGSQVTQLIARRFRELNVYCEIHPYQKISKEFLHSSSAKAIILSGGPASVLDETSPGVPKCIFDLGIPILGICYGQQLMMKMLGGQVESADKTAEFGRAFVTKTKSTPPFLDGWFKEEQKKFGCLMATMLQS